MIRSPITPRPSYVGLLLFAVGVSVVAIVSCLVVFFWFLRPMLLEPAGRASLTEHLDLSADQRLAVSQIEGRFDVERREVLSEFEAAQSHLAELLRREDRYTAEVAAAVETLHHVHGELQSLSIRRYFAVLEILPAEQQFELRRLASEALSRPD